VAQVVQWLPSKHKALKSKSNAAKKIKNSKNVFIVLNEIF
jgi:hypothetical protein